MFNSLMLLVLLSFSTFSCFAQSVPPEKVLKDFYYAYINDDKAASNPELISRCVLSNVIKSITNSLQCNYDSDDSAPTKEIEKICSKKRDCKSYDGYYICNWDGVWVETDVNYFIKSQDVYPSWHNNINVVLLKKNNAGADLSVSLGKYPDPVMKLRVILVPFENSWKISRVTQY